jgi:hypothetical protein
MPVNHLDFVATRLAVGAKSTDTVIKLQPVRGLREKFNHLPIGDFVYLVLQIHGITEVVKYTHTAALPVAATLTIAVERGQHDTVATSFPFGSCVSTTLTKRVFDELLTQRLSAS